MPLETPPLMLEWNPDTRLSTWHMDETFVRIAGKWLYLFRAVDSHGQTVDFYLSETRDREAAKLFLKKAGTVILAVTFLVWILSVIPVRGGQLSDLSTSVIGHLGHTIEPLIRFNILEEESGVNPFVEIFRD